MRNSIGGREASWKSLLKERLADTWPSTVRVALTAVVVSACTRGTRPIGNVTWTREDTVKSVSTRPLHPSPDRETEHDTVASLPPPNGLPATPAPQSTPASLGARPAP